MARREIVVLEDDLDGGKADETVKFTLDGVQYEIDLSEKNAFKMRDAFALYLKAGRKLGRGPVVPSRTRVPVQSVAAKKREDKDIREWARGKGYSIGEFGRIAQHIRDEWANELSGGTTTNRARQLDFSGAAM